MDLLIDVLIDSFWDTLELVPFLFLTYLAMEALEHGAAGKTEKVVREAGKAGPAVGALLGALPQCGFSAMAATLYAGRVVTAGTLVAVILATSDEMLPVFLAHQEAPTRMLAILLIKIVCGMVLGFAVDAVLRLLHRAGDGHAHIHELCEREHCECDECEEEGEEEEKADIACGCSAHHHHHEDEHHGKLWHIARSALIHTAQVTAFIFTITFLFGLMIEGVGSDALAQILADHPVRAIFLSALVGMIPNCGASVTISELFLERTLSTPAMLAGLLSAGGVGLLVLFRTNANMRQNIAIAAFIYVAGVALGLLAAMLGIVI